MMATIKHQTTKAKNYPEAKKKLSNTTKIFINAYRKNEMEYLIFYVYRKELEEYKEDLITRWQTNTR